MALSPAYKNVEYDELGPSKFIRFEKLLVNLKQFYSAVILRRNLTTYSIRLFGVNYRRRLMRHEDIGNTRNTLR